LDKPRKKIFKAREKSGCCAVVCEILCQENADLDLFLEKKRKCACTFMFFNRPVLTVTLREGGVNKYLGKFINNFTCCTVEMQNRSIEKSIV